MVQMQADQLSQTLECFITNTDYTTGVQEQWGQVFASDELVAGEGPEVIAILEWLKMVKRFILLQSQKKKGGCYQVNRSCIHGNKFWNFRVVSLATLDDVGRPGGVVVTLTTVGALHATVTGKKIATHAQGIAMGLIKADKFTWLDLNKIFSLV